MTTRPCPPKFFATAASFRAWLEKHHLEATELLVGFYKRDSGKKSMTWAESVDEALCFGWIDGVRRSLGKDAYTIRFTPRRPGSIWSNVNVAKVQKLIAESKMHPAGQSAFAARSAKRTGIYSFERKEEAKLADTEEAALRANKKAAAFFDANPAWYRRSALHWVASAKRADTRERRLLQLIDDSAAGKTLRHLTRTAASGRAGRS